MRLRYGDEHIPYAQRRRLRVTTHSATEADASGASASVNTLVGRARTEVLTTAAGATYQFTINNSAAMGNAIVTWSLENVTNTGGLPVPVTVSPLTGSLVFTILNAHAATAFNGRIRVHYAIHGFT